MTKDLLWYNRNHRRFCYGKKLQTHRSFAVVFRGCAAGNIIVGFKYFVAVFPCNRVRFSYRYFNRLWLDLIPIIAALHFVINGIYPCVCCCRSVLSEGAVVITGVPFLCVRYPLCQSIPLTRQPLRWSCPPSPCRQCHPPKVESGTALL